MRKLFTSIAVCLGLLSASAQNGYTVKTLTFEDNDYVADTVNYLGQKNWSSLIDSPQYGGELLYGENHGDPKQEYSDVNYRWYDKGNTGLYSELPLNWDTHMYWGGGHAISNYWDGNLQNGDYTHQLSVFVPNTTANGRGGHGHNGSDNFCVHYGYHDNSGYSAENLPWFKFKDGGEYVIDGMWINNTTYFVNCVTNGNGLTTALGANEKVTVKAIGYDKNGNAVDSTATPLARGKNFLITDWSYWDLSKLQNVNKVEFNVEGDTNNGYGFSLPAYFCYDDVAVQIPVNTGNNLQKVQAKAETENAVNLLDIETDPKKKTIYIDKDACKGEIPENCELDFITTSSPDARPGFLPAKGDEYTLTIKGMPQNAVITKIVGHFRFEDYTQSTVIAKIGEKEIANFSYGGWLNDNLDEFPDYLWLSDPTKAELPLLEGADTKCTDNITIHQTNIGEGHAGCISFEIYYTLDTSTGISEITNENTASDAVYTLQGVRVSNPVKGQIYIKNGKKFIMK